MANRTLTVAAIQTSYGHDLRENIAKTEAFVREVEGDEHGQAEHVAGRRRVGRGAHLLVDVRGQLGHVALLEIAADRVALAGDFDGNDAAQIASSCSSMSATRVRMIATICSQFKPL